MERVMASFNHIFISKELDWLKEVIRLRISVHFNQKGEKESFVLPSPQLASIDMGAYASFIVRNNFSAVDRILLALAFVPLLRPQLFDVFGFQNQQIGRRYAEFGGVIVPDVDQFVPTIETLLFILAGGDVPLYIKYYTYFDQHFLFRHQYLLLSDEPMAHMDTFSVLTPSKELIAEIIHEKEYEPQYSPNFPAAKITTDREWSDLILNETTRSQIEEIKLWVQYGQRILDDWELGTKLKPGYKAIFYGPSGTGKSFTASLLGKYTGKEVYRIDLSMIASKYIGDTEKKLSQIFEIAEHKNWILFFDEGDALFGKRTQVKDAHDRYANQEVSYLLQRIEDYNGLIILSTNLKNNLDDAFSRRFQSVVQFPLPSEEERLLLWENTFSSKTIFEESVHLSDIARNYEISGGEILNVVRYCSLMAMKRNQNVILLEDIINGIKKEYRKLGKMI